MKKQLVSLMLAAVLVSGSLGVGQTAVWAEETEGAGAGKRPDRHAGHHNFAAGGIRRPFGAEPGAGAFKDCFAGGLSL